MYGRGKPKLDTLRGWRKAKKFKPSGFEVAIIPNTICTRRFSRKCQPNLILAVRFSRPVNWSWKFWASKKELIFRFSLSNSRTI